MSDDNSSASQLEGAAYAQNEYDTAREESRRYPSYSAGPPVVAAAHNIVWQDLRMLRNSEGSEYTEAQKQIYALNQFEIRIRKFTRGAVTWITIGAPLMWACIWLVFFALRLLVGSMDRT